MTDFHANSTPGPGFNLDLDEIVTEIVRIDVGVEQQRGLSDRDEALLFSGRCEGATRKGTIIAIALRDELIEEMLSRRALLVRLLAS